MKCEKCKKREATHVYCTKGQPAGIREVNVCKECYDKWFDFNEGEKK